MENDAYRITKKIPLMSTTLNSMNQNTSGLTGTWAKHSTVGYTLCKTLGLLWHLTCKCSKKTFSSPQMYGMLLKPGPELTYMCHRLTSQFEKVNQDKFVKHSGNAQWMYHNTLLKKTKIIFFTRYDCLQDFFSPLFIMIDYTRNEDKK